MWFKKDSKSVSYNNLDTQINEFVNKYKTNIILRPKILDQNSSYKITVWVYLATASYVITVQEDYLDISINN